MNKFSVVPNISTINRMQRSFWTTRQVMIKKLGKPEDDCIVASDSELDLQLELLNKTFALLGDFLKILELYQKGLTVLQKRQIDLSMFLNESGISDATDAGVVLRRVGHHIGFIHTSQRNLMKASSRLHGDIGTFTRVAFQDVFLSVENLEIARTSYRGSLMWMKHATKELDPDNPKTMKKLRKVQTQVKNLKFEFERLKMETMQKINMLMASKNQLLAKNVFSYQRCLINNFKIVQRKSNHLLSYLHKTYPHCIVIKVKVDNACNKILQDKTRSISVKSEHDGKVLYRQDAATVANCKNRKMTSEDGEDNHGKIREVNGPTEKLSSDTSLMDDNGLLIDFNEISQDNPWNADSFSHMYERSLSLMHRSVGTKNQSSLDSEQLPHSLPIPTAGDDRSSADANPPMADSTAQFFLSQLLDDYDSYSKDKVADRIAASSDSRFADDKNDIEKNENWMKFLNNWDPLHVEEEEALNEKC